MPTKNKPATNLTQLQKKPLTTNRTQGPGKRLTETERLIIHTERVTSGKSTRVVGKEYGVSSSTVSEIEHDEALIAKLAQAEHIKKGLSADLYVKAQASLDKLTDDRLLKVNAFQNAIIAATCIDKARLIEGASTHNISLAGRFMMLQNEGEE